MRRILIQWFEMSLLLSLLLALILDKLLGEPKRFHPLVGFGNLAAFIERRLNSTTASRSRGVCALLLATLPLTLLGCYLTYLLAGHHLLNILAGGVVLYLAIGWQSLLQHALAVAKPLRSGDLDKARTAVGMIVSRDTENLDEEAISRAATESVLENGADAIFSAIFWFAIAGIPGVILYRLSNTLDAMWGYKTERFLQFGWAAARFDDLLNFIPARLTALSYALVGNTRVALRCWRQQAYDWKSPNAGPVMATGAGALNVSLGGAAQYHDQLQERPPLGPSSVEGEVPSAASIEKACGLVNRALVAWLLSVLLVVVIMAP